MTIKDKKTGYIKSKDQTGLFYRYFATPNSKGTILLIHGFGEHSGRYTHVIEEIQKEGFAVFCFDLRGHGHSQGVRGDVSSFGLYDDDVNAAFQYLLKHCDNKKIFILAHSMGALVALRILAQNPDHVFGVVLSSPLFALKMKVSLWKKWATIMAASFLPRLRVKTGIKGQHLSSDLVKAKAYDQDPLVLKNLSARAFYEIYQGCLSSTALGLKLPVFLQIAGNDSVVDADTAQAWFKKIDQGKVDATMKLYPGFLHEIYNETNRQDPINDFIKWLNCRA